MTKIGIFVVTTQRSVNISILRYLQNLGCKRIIAIVTQPRLIELPADVIQQQAKSNLGAVCAFIEEGDEIEWVISGSAMLNVLLAHQWHRLGNSVDAMMHWWTGEFYNHRRYPHLVIQEEKQ